MKQKKNNLVPFNILYPINIFVKDSNNMSLIENLPVSCGDKNNQLIVIHKWLGRSLCDFIKESKSTLNE